ncbi:hypothetical protein CGCFRS4_v015793 [Colletotrichum fructicola]|nr:hypothetical protein CGCFRS4_v015793 [Colletotrichum fructicola]
MSHRFSMGKTSTDSEIAQECAKHTGKQCKAPAWNDCAHEDIDISDEDCIAIVVDVASSTGQIRIYDAKNTETGHILTKGEPPSFVVLLPDKTENHTCFGHCRIGIIKSEST